MNRNRWLISGLALTGLLVGLTYASSNAQRPASIKPAGTLKSVESGAQVRTVAYLQQGIEIRDAVGDEHADITPEERETIHRAVRTPRSISHQLVYQSFTGPVSQLDDFLRQFLKEFRSQHLESRLTGRKDAPFAIVMSNPEGGRDVRIDIGFSIRARARVHEPLAMRSLSFGSVVSYVHKGAYGQITAAHREIVSSLGGGDRPEGQGRRGRREARMGRRGEGFPTILRLVTDPKSVSSPEDLRTEIIVPTASERE